MRTYEETIAEYNRIVPLLEMGLQKEIMGLSIAEHRHYESVGIEGREAWRLGFESGIWEAERLLGLHDVGRFGAEEYEEIMAAQAIVKGL